MEEKAATSKLLKDSHAAKSVEEEAATQKLHQKTLMHRCAYAVVEVGTGVLLLDGLNMAAIKELFDLPHGLQENQFHVVRTYDMRDCYVANTAPKAKANRYAVGEKKSLQDLIIDGKQANARVIAPKVFLTKEEKVNKKRQTERESRSRKKQRTQTDADKFPEKSLSNHTQ